MARVRGIKKLDARFKRLASDAKEQAKTDVIVGYTASYALHVHELVDMKLAGKPRRPPSKGRYWDPQGRAQAKFLEEPFRTERNKMIKIVEKTYRRSRNLTLSLFVAGQYLQSVSQKKVPVDTGNLKASAFTRKVKR